MLAKVLACMWRGHRAGNYRFNVEKIAREVGCTVGGLEQMLDRKHKASFGPGGPIRGAYNTKTGKKRSGFNLKRAHDVTDILHSPR
jgi:hypothetical protein